MTRLTELREFSMFKSAIPILSIIILTACATTQSPETKNKDVQTTGKISEFDGQRDFYDLKDGGKYQTVTGLHCPASAMDGTIESTKVYAEDGSDVSCFYRGGPGMTTVYLTEAPNYALDEYFDIAKAAVTQGSFKDRVEFQEKATESCMIETQLMSGLMGLLGGMGEDKKDNTITIDMSGNGGAMPFKVAVFGSDALSSYVAVSPIDDKFMKIRYTTQQGISEERYTKDCQALNRLMRDQIASVGKPGGAKAQRSILDFLADTP